MSRIKKGIDGSLYVARPYKNYTGNSVRLSGEAGIAQLLFTPLEPGFALALCGALVAGICAIVALIFIM